MLNGAIRTSEQEEMARLLRAKSQLMIAIGCTGGKHRSITFARKIGEYCTKLGYQPSVQHRDARRTA